MGNDAWSEGIFDKWDEDAPCREPGNFWNPETHRDDKAAELPEIEGRLKVVNLQPGDVLVLTFPRSLNDEVRADIRARVRARYGVDCMVLDSGVELADVLRQNEPCPTP